VVACECREGLGSEEFCRLMRSIDTPEEFFQRYSDPKNFVIDQWCAQNIYQALDHAGEVYIYSSGLSNEDIEGMDAIEVKDLQETIDRLVAYNPRTVVVPEGPYVVGMVG